MSLGDAFPAIIQAARLGEEWAWTRIYRDLAPTVLGYVRARGAAEPEDVTGDVFLQVVRSLSSFDGDETGFRAWVFTITHHRLLNERRTLARRPVTLSDDVLPEREAAESVETAVERKIENERLRSLIQSLSPDQRDVLLLRIIGGFTVDEIAEVIGKRVGAVKALQRRGLAALEKTLTRQGVPL